MGRDSTQSESRLSQLEEIYRELLPIVLGFSRQGEQMLELALMHNLTSVMPDLERICKAIRDLKEVAGSLANPGLADRLVAEPDLLKAQKTLRHDLRTPINAIKGYGEILLEDLAEFEGEAIRSNLLQLLEEATELSARIYSIVNLGAVEPGPPLDEGLANDPVAAANDKVSPLSEAGKGPFAGRRTSAPGNVLVVDDVEDNREILSERLLRQGHTVTVAETGVKALELLRGGGFELVLLDVLMPGMDGYEVLARIKSDPELRDIPVIMVSALDEMDSVIRCIELGAEDYLPKAFDPILLRARVSASLEKKKWLDREREHVTRLAAAMRQVEDGDLSVNLDDSGGDVYAAVYRGFNRMTSELRDEAEILGLAHDLSGETALDPLLDKFVRSTAHLLDAEDARFLLYDRNSEDLWTRLPVAANEKEIRIAADEGLAGAVFRSGEILNLADVKEHPAYAGRIDTVMGAETRSLLSMPVITKAGETVGVMQVVNKRSADKFTPQDETRLSAFCAQIAFTLYNAQLFEEVVQVKNYNENILKSSSASLITLDLDGQVVTANERAERFFGPRLAPLNERHAIDLFTGEGSWVTESIRRVQHLRRPDIELDTALKLPDGRTATVNLTAAPLFDGSESIIGTMLSIEDVSGTKRLRSTMSRYMSKEVVDQLLDGGEAALGGKAHQATILFSDISGFTGLAEALGPKETVSMLNDYFAEMVDVLFEHSGILDKYIGDGIMALFGVPFENPTDPDHAVAAAVEMMANLRRLNRRRERTGQSPIGIRIGIDTGDVIAGNIGSPRRMEYTVIGDCVNLAARLEEANKFYGTSILIGEYTLNSLQSPIFMREIDLIRVSGREAPVAIFEPLAYHTKLTFPSLDRIIVPYQRGLEAYRARDWDAGLKFFDEALAAAPEDGPSRIYRERCLAYRKNPPPEHWDGVYKAGEN
ncbi:MAG TPA: hypothetical protein DCS82_07800 [Rhodospirillaceae bacterium]|nr:hypothetical protein [Rhodospirillaceae bacterium]HAT35603.1 hypothetical protein [Rhodospirillaceae bacterium]